MRQYIFSILILLLFIGCDEECNEEIFSCNNLWGSWECLSFTTEYCDGTVSSGNTNLTWKFTEGFCSANDMTGSNNFNQPKWRIYDSSGLLAETSIDCNDIEFNYCNTQSLDGCNFFTYSINNEDNLLATRYQSSSLDPIDCQGEKDTFILTKQNSY